jgi:hypothetical protein
MGAQAQGRISHRRNLVGTKRGGYGNASAMRPLTLTAWLNVGLHLGGLAFAVAALRPGTPLVPAAERVAYLAARPLGWSLGWAAWMLCALALVAFLAVLAHVVPEAPALGTAVMLASAGAAVDLVCDTLYITVLPGLAAGGPTPLFLTVERALGAGGVVVANGLYTVATLIATLDLRARPGVPAAVTWLGYATFAGGMLMVAAGFTGDPDHLQLATGAAIVPYMAWTVGVARSLRA